MKIVIAGSSGFVGTELVRQALAIPVITSVVGLSRRETILPPLTAGADKLKSIVCDNFDSYSDDLLKELYDVDACIWYPVLICLRSHMIIIKVSDKALGRLQ